jgi:two-component system, NtrC family, response regulator HydG
MSLVATIRRLNQANDQLLRRMNQLKTGEGIIGVCPVTRRLATVLARAAESSVTVLIEGPIGSGKSLAAQTIHTSSRMSSKRLEVTYGDTLTAERIDHLLIDGRIGTLLLENVEHLLPEVQSKIVRYIKERSAGNPAERQGVRIMATTSAHLPELVARGKFREDLYYRLNVFPINIPSLRERREDISSLAAHFLAAAAERAGDESPGFTDAATAMLESHNWPGNVAQLQDAVIRAHVLARGTAVDRRHLHGVTTGMSVEPTAEASGVQDYAPNPNASVTEEDILPLETEEKRLLGRALKATKGNVRRAAQLLHIGRATLYRKIQVYKLKLN